MLTQKQIQSLVSIIDKYNVTFISRHIGTDVLTDNDKAILKNNGIDLKKFPKISTVEKAFKWGMLSDAIGKARSKIMSYPQFQKYLKEGKFLPLTEREKEALNYSKLKTYNHVRGLGNKVSKDLSIALIEVDKNQRIRLEKLIKREVTEAILDRKSSGELASILAEKSQDWNRDWERIAVTELHNAFMQGKAEQIRKTRGAQSFIFYEVLSDACDSCKKLYLNPDGSPRKFLLSYIIKNGSNIGRKSNKWKPVAESVHPHCRCEMFSVDYDAQLDNKKKQFVEKKYISSVGRKSHAKVTIS